MADLTHHYAQLKGVRLHYVTAGQGRPVLLVHGYPQTWYEWRKLIPLLADGYFLVAPDTRGLGDSSRPLEGYDKRRVADDLWKLMHDVLGHDRFIAIGHDWGAPTAFRLAADHPGNITHLVMLDVPVPGDQPRGGTADGTPRWHHLFHQVPDLPEALTAGRERLYLEYFFANGCDVADAITDADIREYVRTYSQPGAMRAGFSYYRNMRRDVELNRADFTAGFKLPMPCLGIGGGGPRGRGDLVVESLRRVCAGRVEGGALPGCGHFIPEEKPVELAAWLRRFLAEDGSGS
ncbi:MAG: alpha/beta fold hydrolase [Pseudomonadota bacterium]